MSTKNIIISAGHGGNDPGAVVGNVIEHTNAYVIAWLLRAELVSMGHAVEFISCFNGLAKKILNVNELHAVKPVDLAVEIHFNSADTPSANGTEVLYYSAKTEPLAMKISHSLSEAIGTADRGAKKRTDLGWLKQTQPPALIVEVCFISNPDDVFRMLHDDFQRTAARGIAVGVI